MSERAEHVFKGIYESNGWRSGESVSGWGSELRNTAQVIRELPHLLRRHGVYSMLDAPCGDFNWMRHVDLSGVRYVGAEIVPELVAAHQAQWANPDRTFIVANLLVDRLPDCDLILCRDCLFHFPHADVFRALENFARTSARFLLTTTFTYRSYPRNGDIRLGEWTAINLEMAPFELDPPIASIVEGSSEFIDYGPPLGQVPMFDRALGLWDMQDIRKRLRRR